jgi:SAM-dependent methyltransferase
VNWVHSVNFGWCYLVTGTISLRLTKEEIMETEAMMEWWQQRQLESAGSRTRSQIPEWLQSNVLAAVRDVIVKRIGEFVDQHGPGLPLKRVVDLGCAIGDWSLAYTSFAEEVLALDVNEEYIEAARLAAVGHPCGKQARFFKASMLDFDDFAEAGLVCLGGSSQYLDDADLDRMLGRIANKTPKGAVVYLRTTTVNPPRRARSGACGRYRTIGQMEASFKRAGLRIYDRFFTLSAFPDRVARDLLGVLHPISIPVSHLLRFFSLITRNSDQTNWLAINVGKSSESE